MVLTIVITAVVFITIYILIQVGSKKLDKTQFDFATGATKAMLAVVHVAFFIGLFPLILGLLLYFTEEEDVGVWVSYGFSVFITLFALLSLYDLLYDYEAIQGDTIISHRFFKTISIKINDVKSVGFNGAYGLSLKDKDEKTLLKIAPNTPKLVQFFALITQRNGGRIFNINDVLGIMGEPLAKNDNPFDHETMTLTRLGRDYRKDFKKHLRNFSIFYGAILGIFSILPSVGLALLGEHLIIVGLLVVPLLIILVFSYIKIRKNMIKELEHDDVWLGNKYKFKNKFVKGANKNHFKGIKLNCLIWLVGGCAIGGITWPIVATTKEVPLSELHTVTGPLLYNREQYGKSSYFAVGLSNLETEYRLSSIDEDEFDYSFIEEVEVGDEIILLIDDSEDLDFSMSDVEKTQWNYFYGLSANGKDYFTYDDYLKAFHDNARAGFTIAYISLGSALLSATVLIASYVIYKKKEKEENIRIY